MCSVAVKVYVSECVSSAGIDDAASECDLDTGVTFDVAIDNNGDDEYLTAQLTDLVHSINNKL